MPRFRNLKQELARVLAGEGWAGELAERAAARPERLTGPLLALRLDREEIVRWRAAEGLGILADSMARERLERARVLMRTFMWYMNEESGNLGWGIPEAMACAMARNSRLAGEYHTILASYVYCEEDLDGNYLDHPELRQGVWWGLARLAGERPAMVEHAERFLLRGLAEDLAFSRGCAAWALGSVGSGASAGAVEAVEDDQAKLTLYREDRLEETTVGALAGQALEDIRTRAGGG